MQSRPRPSRPKLEPGSTEIDPEWVVEIYQQATPADSEALFRSDAAVKARYGYAVRGVVTTGHVLEVTYLRPHRSRD